VTEGTVSGRLPGRSSPSIDTRLVERAMDAFVGRSAEVTRLEAAVDAAAAGSVRVVLIEGEPGIGKTRLLAELVEIARRRGFAIKSGRAEELERDRAFGAVAVALGMEQMPVPAVMDPSAPTAPLRFEFFDRVLETVADYVRDRPLLLAFDDLQWADPASLEAIDLVSRRLPDARLLIAGACRPIPRSTELARLANSLRDVVERIALPPLDPNSIRQLAESLAGHPIGANLARHTASAGGNPFFVRELIGALGDDGLITLVDGHADITAPALPPSLRATIMRRLGFLPEPTLELLRWATILGSSFALADLAIACSQNTPEVIRGLDPAVRVDVLVDVDPRLEFRHDLVREAIYGDIPRAVRAGMHLEVAQRRIAAGARALDVAPHFARGVVGRDVVAAEWMRRAAAEVTAQSPAAAVELLERGLEMTVSGDEIRAQISSDLVRALLWSGRWAEAELLARQILEREPDTARAAALRYSLARSFAYRGRMAESIAEAEAAIASVATNERDRARLLADISLRRPLAGDLAGGEAAALAALESAAPDNTLARRTALSGLALIAALRGQTVKAVETARGALPLSAESAAEAVELVQPSFFLTIVLTEADGFAEAISLMRQLRQQVETRMSWVSALVGVLIGHLLFLTGEWTDAFAEAETALELSEETGTRVWSLRAMAILATISARRGDAERAAELVRQGDAMVEEIGRAHVGFDHWLLARVAAADAAGDHDAAAARLEAAWDECERIGWVVSRRIFGPPLVRLAIERGGSELAEAVTTAVREAASVEGAPSSMAAAADHCAGLLASDAAALARAADGYRAVGRKLALAEALEDAGVAYVAAGRRADGRAALDEAVSAYAALGAEAGRLRAEQRLRQLGVRRGAIGRRRRPDTGWESLTGSEVQIARLAAEGLTNREIGDRLYVSHRTVATHLAHIFGKLGLSSRVELAGALARGEFGAS
jgi:DNA-binding CsgD family transcriptional regulator